MCQCAMPDEATEDSSFELRASEGTTEVTTPQIAWPFAPSREPKPAEERAEHAEDLLEERPELSGYDQIVDASFPASDPPPSPMTHLGKPR